MFKPFTLYTRLSCLIAAVVLISAAAFNPLALAGEGSELAPAGRTGQITQTACPAFLPRQTLCETGTSQVGAQFIIAKPKNWNGALILFAHGGPRLGPPQLSETIEDLEKFQMLVAEGYGWAGSTYRRGGYGVRSAAEDMDHLRAIIWSHWGRPSLTILHGQSWGANVAAKAGELYGLDLDGRRNFDGVVLTSGVLAGGTRAYQLRADLRAVYQYYCNNHPRPTEPAYPVWQGLPAGSNLNRADLAERVRECTGIGSPAAVRTPDQAARLSNITKVLSIDETQVLPNLVWGTFTFADMISRLAGRNPYSNQGTMYRGSPDDQALNAGVQRFTADPAALAQLAYDSDLSGLIVAPTITLHGVQDKVANVSNAIAYRQTLERSGRIDLLVQAFTSESEHSRLSAPAYPAVFAALVSWIRSEQRPTTEGIEKACRTYARRLGEPCLFTPFGG